MIAAVAGIDTKRFYIDLGEIVRRRRRAIGQTQADLAIKLGLARASIANIESGRQKTLTHQFFQLATALELQIADLLPPVNPGAFVGKEVGDLPLPEGLSARQRAQISHLFHDRQPSETKQRDDKKE